MKPLREKGERGDARLDELLSASGRERDGNAEHKKAENDDEWDDDVARESRGAAAASTRAGEARAKR